MTSIIGGLAAALFWGTSTLVASRSTRRIGSQLALAWVLLLGLGGIVAITAVAGAPPHPHPSAWVWALTSGVGSTVGLLCMYQALRIGRVGVVAPIGSTEGAVAAVLSVAILGEHLSAAEAVALAVIVAGVITVTFHGHRGDVDLTSALWALGSATFFGIGLVASARAGDDLGPYWTITISRVIGVALVVLPLVAAGGFRRPTGAWRLVGYSAFAEIAGFIAYVLGARHSIAIAAVLGSQFAAVAAIGAYVVLGERLTRRQITGAVVIIAGVTALAIAQS